MEYVWRSWPRTTPYEPQQMLLPEAFQDWLTEGHLAHFTSDRVDTLDLGAFHARYDKDGPQPAVPSGHDGQGAGVWVCDGAVQLVQRFAKAMGTSELAPEAHSFFEQRGGATHVANVGRGRSENGQRLLPQAQSIANLAPDGKRFIGECCGR